MIELFDGLACVFGQLKLNKGEVVVSIFIFFDAKFINFAVSFEQSSQFILNSLFRLVSVDVGDEDLAGLIYLILSRFVVSHDSLKQQKLSKRVMIYHKRR